MLVVEHDLAVLDYLSDYICCLYGTPSAYGVVTMPFSVREGINMCVRFGASTYAGVKPTRTRTPAYPLCARPPNPYPHHHSHPPPPNYPPP